MIFADKLIDLRKKNGMSQEELAEKMNVSRQSVSKWEGAQSMPDLNKIVNISKIFGVTTDFLLNDEIDTPENQTIETADTSADDVKPLRKVSMEEASEFLRLNEKNARRTAFGVFLCIIAFIPLFLLGVAGETGKLPMSEDAAASVGVIILLVIGAVAVVFFMLSEHEMKPFEYLDEEDIDTEYGVSGMVKEKKKSYDPVCIRNNILGVTICILSVVPLFGSILVSENDFVNTVGLCIMFLICSFGVNLLVRTGIISGGFERLLEEGDYSKENKAEKRDDSKPDLGAVYWLVVIAIFLAVGFIAGDWGNTWIIPAVGAVLYGAFHEITKLFGKKSGKM